MGTASFLIRFIGTAKSTASDPSNAVRGHFGSPTSSRKKRGRKRLADVPAAAKVPLYRLRKFRIALPNGDCSLPSVVTQDSGPATLTLLAQVPPVSPRGILCGEVGSGERDGDNSGERGTIDSGEHGTIGLGNMVGWLWRHGGANSGEVVRLALEAWRG